MNIKISERLLKKYQGLENLFKRVNVIDEIGYHVHVHGNEPKRITIIHYLEDSEKLKPTKNHMILTID